MSSCAFSIYVIVKDVLDYTRKNYSDVSFGWRPKRQFIGHRALSILVGYLRAVVPHPFKIFHLPHESDFKEKKRWKSLCIKESSVGS